VGFVADILGFGNAAGPHYKLDYSTATGAGITTLTQAQLASSTGVSNIIYASADGRSVVLRSDVDVDPIATNGYPRSEWRELATDGTTNRAFNPTTGDHANEVLVLPMHLPPFKPAFVLNQLHDAVQDLLEIVVQGRSDYATSGKLEVALKVAVGGSSSSSGLPRFIADFGTPAELATNPKWLQAKIRCGAIAPGAAPGWSATVNGVTINSWDDGIPTWDGINGTNSYYKTGMYLQTKWTGSDGGNGLETDRNEYGECAWRFIKVTHNGESAPFVPVIGSRVEDTTSGVTWGTKATAHRSVNPSAMTLNPGLPSGLTAGDVMFCIIRESRGANSVTLGTSTVPAPQTSPSSPDIATTGWDKVIAIKSPAQNTAPVAGAYPGAPHLAAHNVRWMLWAKPWASGDGAPQVDIASGSTLTDTCIAQVGKCSGAKLTTVIAELLDQLPAGLDVTIANSNNNETGINYAASTSTTTLGPTAATPGTPKPGSLALACVYHETNTTTTTVPVVTGGSDALTWAEGGQNSLVSISGTGSNIAEDEPAWANDWAIVPMSGYNQVIPAKSAVGAAGLIAADAAKPPTGTTAGKGWGVALTIEPAKKHRHTNRVCTSVG